MEYQLLEVFLKYAMNFGKKANTMSILPGLQSEVLLDKQDKNGENEELFSFTKDNDETPENQTF